MVEEELKEIKKKKRRLLLVISGPTCSGKDSVMKGLLERHKDMRRLVTTNTREKRKDEAEGEDYYFVTKVEFEKLIAKGAFYEWVEYRGNYRGGQKRHVREALKSGKDVVWRIDVRGVKNIYEKVKEDIPNSVFIFLYEDLSVLKKRMEKRATESKRWQNWSVNRALWELKQYKDFDYCVFNKEGNLKETIKKVEYIMEAERLKVKR